MIDPFVILTPIFLLGLIALFGFVGCNQVYGLHETTPTPKPDPPANFQAVPGDNKVSLTWDLDTSATEYTVFRAMASFEYVIDT